MCVASGGKAVGQAVRHCENDEAAQCLHGASLRCWDTCSTGPIALPRRLADFLRVLYDASVADATALEFPGGLALPLLFSTDKVAAIPQRAPSRS